MPEGGFLIAQLVKNPPAMREIALVQSLVRKIPWRREKLLTPVFWPREFHGLYSPWNSPGNNTGVGSLSLLQGIFPTQGSNPGLPHCRQILYQPSHKVSPRILEWAAYPFSSGYSWPSNWTGVSCIAGGFFTNWAMRKPPSGIALFQKDF